MHVKMLALVFGLLFFSNVVSVFSDFCSMSPCKNGGTCTSLPGGYECTCAAGYQGPKCCQTESPCDSNPCKFGTCTGNGSGYTCTCQADFTGTTCDTVIDDCAGVSCNSGTCVDTVNNYWCDCTGTSNSGRYCEL
ncbi:fibropellin-1-like [Mya arenaria]|uniref:fibropellin-1-like n=1 Tax=Mya arenaria TaxID=6604 RepID=UPI0022DF06DB|nr:fibropellin-1-like [Mya arenaria]